MPFYKKIRLKHINDSKYGSNHQGLFAVEKIYKDEELIYEEDEANEVWPFYPVEDKRGKYTKSEVLQLIKDHPQLEDIIYRQSYLVDDDVYNVPFKYIDGTTDYFDGYKRLLHPALFLNHSCDPNIGWRDGKCYALRDIEVGEEIMFDYSTLVDAAHLLIDTTCRCGSSNCRNSPFSNAYTDPQWREKNKDFCSPYILKKIEQFYEKQNI